MRVHACTCVYACTWYFLVCARNITHLPPGLAHKQSGEVVITTFSRFVSGLTPYVFFEHIKLISKKKMTWGHI